MLIPLTSSEPRREKREALVVGAGPAGLFASFALALRGVETLLIDAGPDVSDRRMPSGDGDRRVSYEEGVGGAGLFSDGKLCLSLDVGGHLEEDLDEQSRAELLGEIEAVFAALLPEASAQPLDDIELAATSRAAAAAGLTFKHYPVAHIGTDRCWEVIAGLRSLLEEVGVEIRANSELRSLSLDPGSGQKIASVQGPDGPEEIHADSIVLALGKVGAERSAALCQGLGIAVEDQPLYLGVRFEAADQALEGLFAETKDPKYSYRFPDGSKLKTHCASEQGEVIALEYAGLPLAGGHNYSWAETNRSGFSLLWDGAARQGDGYQLARGVMRRVNCQTGGRLLAQRLTDLIAGDPSREHDLVELPLSCSEWVAGDVRSVLPPAFFPRMESFLERLRSLAPDLDQDAVVYAPAIEWWMKRTVVDEKMRSAVAGVSICGDGSGWSQGIVHAAATGLLAADGIRRGRAISSWLAESDRSAALPAYA